MFSIPVEYDKQFVGKSESSLKWGTMLRSNRLLYNIKIVRIINTKLTFEIVHLLTLTRYLVNPLETPDW